MKDMMLVTDKVVTPHDNRVPAASIHTKAAVTWVAIFPLVSLGMCILSWVAPRWHPILRSLTLTIVVVPLSVYFLVPWLLSVRDSCGRAIIRSKAEFVSKRRRGQSRGD